MAAHGSELNDAIWEGKTELALQLLAAKADPHAADAVDGK